MVSTSPETASQALLKQPIRCVFMENDENLKKNQKNKPKIQALTAGAPPSPRGCKCLNLWFW